MQSLIYADVPSGVIKHGVLEEGPQKSVMFQPCLIRTADGDPAQDLQREANNEGGA